MRLPNRTYRFVALMLAFLMFFISAGFVVDLHYCQGELKSISLFGKARSCHDMAESALMKNCPHHKKMMAEKKGCSIDRNCCSNKTIYFQYDQDQQIQISTFVVSKQLQQFVIAYTVLFMLNDFSIEQEAAAFAHYKPPLISRDILVHNQSFLL